MPNLPNLPCKGVGAAPEERWEEAADYYSERTITKGRCGHCGGGYAVRKDGTLRGVDPGRDAALDAAFARLQARLPLQRSQ